MNYQLHQTISLHLSPYNFIRAVQLSCSARDPTHAHVASHSVDSLPLVSGLSPIVQSL